MTLSEQVAELEKQARAADDREEYYRNGLRAGLRGDMMTETDPGGAMNRGWREGGRLRRLVRMDLEGFRAGVLGETFGDGSDPAFVAGRHEGEKVRAEIVRLERAQAPAPTLDSSHVAKIAATLDVGFGTTGARTAYEQLVARRTLSALVTALTMGELGEIGEAQRADAAPTPTPDGHYIIRNVPGYTRPVHAKVAGGNVWGYSVYAGVAGYRTIGFAVSGWAKPEMKWEEEKALPVGPVRPVQPCPICHRQMFAHPDSELFLDGDGPHTCDEGTKKAAPTVRTGGNPPAPEIGMVYTSGAVTCMVCALPHRWPDNVTEVRAPWGGAVVWRRA